MPLRAPTLKLPTYLNQVADITPILTPTEVDHYQLQRTIDVYVAPSGEDLGQPGEGNLEDRRRHHSSHPTFA